MQIQASTNTVRKTISAQQNFENLHVRDKSRTPSKDAQKGQTFHPPNPGALRRALPQARPQQCITRFQKGSLDWSQTARIEGAHSDRVVSASERAIQATLSILFQHPAKPLCATMRHDEMLVLPVTHAHRPVEPFRSGSRATHGRFTRHDRTVL